MEITITHCRYAPRWDSLQTVIREATNEPEGELRRIARHDKGSGYREPGVYALSFALSNGCILPITLNVVAIGKGVSKLSEIHQTAMRQALHTNGENERHRIDENAALRRQLDTVQAENVALRKQLDS